MITNIYFFVAAEEVSVDYYKQLAYHSRQERYILISH